MAQIIDIRSFESNRTRRGVEVSGGAEILFFLGVRYERMPEPTSPRSPGPADLPTGKLAVKKRRKRRA